MTVKSDYLKQYPNDIVERIFRHKNSIIVEAYPKDAENYKTYASYKIYNQDTGTFDIFNPANVSRSEVEAMFESAQNPIYIRDEKLKQAYKIDRKIINSKGGSLTG